MLAYFVIIPVLIAVFLYLFSSAKSGRILAILIQAALVAFSYYLFSLSRVEEIVTVIGIYDGDLGIVLMSDNLSSSFILLTSFIFLITSIYSFHENNKRLFWFLLFLWEGLLIGIFLTRDFFNIFVLMEVLAIVVVILIMFNRENRNLYDGIIYLMANLVAIQFYLFGVGYVYMITGTLDMYLAAQYIAQFDRSALILPYALIMTGIAFKCALLPLFSWLPKAHGTPSAPSSVSAILSGLHIKSSVYLFLRIQQVFQDISAREFFLVIGIATGIVGFIMALSQKDLKLILAYHTISQVGLIMAALNIGDFYSHIGGLYHIFNHALFKSCLFLSAGVIAEIYKTREVYKIRGVFKEAPIIGLATILAVFGITGAPLFNGSISKYFIATNTNWLLNAILIFMSLGTIISFIKYSSILWGKSSAGETSITIDKCRQLTTLILGLFCFFGGIFGAQFIEFLFNVQVSMNFIGYLEKVLVFAISLTVGYLIYTHFIKTSSLLGRICKARLNFRGMCASMGIFFMAILMITGYFYS
ncbi:MAG: proton-conducting membrane transporter [Oscillospiraceae bacterium]|nr:proton-conducting membrane transporter [Oscillospiraceae bacterium]